MMNRIFKDRERVPHAAARLLAVTCLFSMSGVGVARIPSWADGGGATAASRGAGGGEMFFRCPKAYLGIREDLLPTHWEVRNGRLELSLKASQVQQGEMLCTYRNVNGLSMGSVVRLVPQGYKCLSDGVGNFRCQARR